MSVEQVSVDNFYSWLQNKSQNTVNTPYEVEITGLTVNNQSSIILILQDAVDKYIDLRPTSFPTPVSFYGIQALVYPPSFSSFSPMPSVSLFGNCSNLKESPVFSNSVTNFNYMFENCTSLEVFTVGSININTISYSHIFEGCTSLTTFRCDNPVEVKQWLTAIKNESIDNFPNDPDNCYYIPYSTVEIPFSLLNDYLSSLPANTASTPYAIKVTELTASNIGTSGTVGTLGNVILSNGLKYVDLRHTVIPSGVIDMHECFSGCTSLTTAPDIPARVTSLAACFDNCRSLITAPDIPSGVTSMGYCFSYCTSLTTAPKIPDSVTDLTFCFNQCRSLITAPNIPSGVTMLRNCFSGCRSLTTAPKIPDSVTNMYDCFGSCTSLTTVPNIPDSVRNLNDCFSGCTSLEEITLFEADLATLVTNNKAQNCFYNCPNLTKIGTIKDPTPHEYNDWNIYRLKFDSNSVQGKVFHRDGTSHSITQTSITKSSLQLPILTDELWFPTESDSDIESIIAKMIQYKYGVFKKEIIPPDEKSFVLMADDPNNVKSNILPEVEYPIPESKGGTGQTSLANVTVGNATKATSAGKLTTARKTYVTLGTASTSTTRDWSGDTTIPVNGTLNVANGGTGMTTASYKNAVVVGNSSTVTNALRTIRTANGAFYATAQDGAPAFGTLPVGQGGTGATSLANITVGNSSKLGNISVQTTSIGGGSSETGNHWSYVTKAKFTSTSGYIVYSNGLKIQWQNNTDSGWDRTINLTNLGLLSFTSETSYVVTMTFDWGTGSNKGYDKCTRVYGKTASSFKTWVDGAGKVSWIAIGY